MRKSEKISTLEKAIMCAEDKFRSISRASKNPHFKSDYADLDEVLSIIHEPLAQAGVSIRQFPDINAAGNFVLTTRISHPESGEFMETDYVLLLEKNTCQGQGSAITYARRYSLTSIFNLHEFDDDGNAASAPYVNHQAVSVQGKIKPVDAVHALVLKIAPDYLCPADQQRAMYSSFKSCDLPIDELERAMRKQFEDMYDRRKI